MVVAVQRKRIVKRPALRRNNCATMEIQSFARTGCSKSPSSKAAGESKPEAYPLGYVEDFEEPRTPLAGFFSILPKRLGFQNRFNFFHMTVDLDLAENRLQLAGLVDDKGTALDSPILSAVHIFLFITPVGFRDGSLFIAQQCEGQVELLDELLVRLFAVQTHTENDGPRLLDRRAGIAKVA